MRAAYCLKLALLRRTVQLRVGSQLSTVPRGRPTLVTRAHVFTAQRTASTVQCDVMLNPYAAAASDIVARGTQQRKQ